MLQTWKSWARSLKQNIAALYLASRDPRVPKTAKVLILLVVAYALSPIDIIPDFVPILGYLDDLIVLPLGIALAIRLIPKEVWEECCQRTRELGSGRLPANRIAAVVIVDVWLLGLAIICRMVWKYSSLLTVAR